jgi:hypothetical protein
VKTLTLTSVFAKILSDCDRIARDTIYGMTFQLFAHADEWADQERKTSVRAFCEAYADVTGDTCSPGYASLLLNFSLVMGTSDMDKAVRRADKAGVSQSMLMALAVALKDGKALLRYVKILQAESFPARKIHSLIARLKEQAREQGRKARPLSALTDDEVLAGIALVLAPKAPSVAPPEDPPEYTEPNWQILYGRAAELLYMFGLKVDAETLGDDTRYTEVRNAVKKVIDDKASKVAKAS